MASNTETNNGPGWNINHTDVTVDIKEQKTTDNDNSDANDLEIVEGSTLNSKNATNSTANNPNNDVLHFGSPFVVERKNAKFTNVQKEILNNTFHQLKVKQWNELLKKCVVYSRTTTAQKLRLSLSEIVALKLYTGFDGLQLEYRKCFKQSLNDNDRWNRQTQFYHWNASLLKACNKAQDIITEKMYYGIDESFFIPCYSGIHYGPVRTSTKFEIAQTFTGEKGTIFELYPSFGRKALCLSWLSNFPDKNEVFLYMNTSFTSFQIVKIDSWEKTRLFIDGYIKILKNKNKGWNIFIPQSIIQTIIQFASFIIGYKL